ncbi:MAG: response regulator [Deltaproteobacteria bacterium]|nr:response regulator [Deltaproteobacteria bacterium]
MNVLLVDDEAELVSAMAERLSFRGIEADWADSGRKALEMARDKAYDVAVLDVKMPGIGGFALQEELKALHPGMCFVFLSGHGSEDDFIKGSAKASSYLVKPVDIDELVRQIKAAMGVAA